MDITYEFRPRDQKIANARRKGMSVQGGGAKRLLTLLEIEQRRYKEAQRRIEVLAAQPRS